MVNALVIAYISLSLMTRYTDTDNPLGHALCLLGIYVYHYHTYATRTASAIGAIVKLPRSESTTVGQRGEIEGVYVV